MTDPSDDLPTPTPDDDDEQPTEMGDLLAGLLGGDEGGGLDMGSLLQSAMDMQQQLLDAQEDAASQVITGQSGGGAVKITANGVMEFSSVEIAPEAVDPDDVEMLGDLVLAALRDLSTQVADLAASSMPGPGGMDLGGMDLGGMDLGGMDLGGMDLGGMGLGGAAPGQQGESADGDGA